MISMHRKCRHGCHPPPVLETHGPVLRVYRQLILCTLHDVGEVRLHDMVYVRRSLLPPQEGRSVPRYDAKRDYPNRNNL